MATRRGISTDANAEAIEMNQDGVTPQERTHPKPAESLAQQDWAEVAKHGIGSMTPASTGWLLAVVVMFIVLLAANYMDSTRQAESLRTYLDNEHKLREVDTKNRSEQMRRCQEIVKELTDTIARQSDRLSRTTREAELIRQTKKPVETQ